MRPVQKNGGYPDLEAGLRLAFNGWTGARQQAYGHPAIGRMAIGVSGIGRHFEVANFIENPTSTNSGTGYGVVGNVFLPVIPAWSAEERGNALSFTAEYSRGTGIADMYSDLTGGLLFPSLPNPQDRQQPTNPPPVYTPNIEQRHRDVRRRQSPAHLQLGRPSVAGAQYYLPIAHGRALGVWDVLCRIRSSNIKDITPMPGWGGIFTHAFVLRRVAVRCDHRSDPDGTRCSTQRSDLRRWRSRLELAHRAGHAPVFLSLNFIVRQETR